ncbi:hypothetical protein TWF694_002443 [Orbilia ellipsospora]|uniref:Dehydrin n=1 Tax=Orbilia ellipsospora TaxID=2528407 RepID=A0AAV9X231_9PEZI
METINQATTAIKETIWGSGANGGTGTHSEVHKSMIDDTVTERKFNGRLESDPDAEGSYQPDQNDSGKVPQGPTSTGGKPQGANVTGENRGTNDNPHSSSNEPNTGFGGSSGAQPSVNADPSSGQQDTTKHQGGDKPTSGPDATPPTGSGDSGMSGGNMGGGAGGGAGGMKLPDSENESKGEGTGEKYEKSTGLAADGGDFDATRPGAAREAQRLMDEKGIKHGDQPGTSGEPPKEKKWYGVDHSGFGGHGSHQNKRLSFSKSSDEKKAETNDINNNNDNLNQTEGQTDTLATGEEHKGLGQKIKEKLHHSSSN